MTNENGWVKIYRKITDWGWYSDRNVRDTFIHLILTTSHKNFKFLGKDFVAGERVFGVAKLAKEIGISAQQLRTSLDKLKSTNEITIKTTNKYSVVSINKYYDYQADNKQNNKQVTNNQQTSNNNQEYKNIRSKEDIYIAPEKIKEISNKYKVQESSVKTIYEDLILYCKSSGKKYKDYEAALMSWTRRRLSEGKIKTVVKTVIPNEEHLSEEQRLINLKKLSEIKSNFGRTWTRS